MTRTTKLLILFLTIIILPLVAYFVPYSITVLLPMSWQESEGHALLYIFFIMLLLTIPYLVVKSVSYIAHLVNERESVLQVKDLPDDQIQMKNPAR